MGPELGVSKKKKKKGTAWQQKSQNYQMERETAGLQGDFRLHNFAQNQSCLDMFNEIYI